MEAIMTIFGPMLIDGQPVAFASKEQIAWLDEAWQKVLDEEAARNAARTLGPDRLSGAEL